MDPPPFELGLAAAPNLIRGRSVLSLSIFVVYNLDVVFDEDQ